MRAFTAASLKGWRYALSHKEEIVDLILQRYSRQKSRDALMFEASHTQALVQPDLIELGYQNQQHWKHIADTYRDLGMLGAASEPERQVFQADDAWLPAWLKYVLFGLVLAAIAAALVWLWSAVLGRRIAAALGTPKLSAVMSVLFVSLSVPILIFILLYNFPAGLLVYWITTNLWTVSQGYLLRKKLGPITPPKPTGGDDDGDAKTGSSFFSRLTSGVAAKAAPATAPAPPRKPSGPPPPSPRKKKKRSGRRR